MPPPMPLTPVLTSMPAVTGTMTHVVGMALDSQLVTQTFAVGARHAVPLHSSPDVYGTAATTLPANESTHTGSRIRIPRPGAEVYELTIGRAYNQAGYIGLMGQAEPADLISVSRNHVRLRISPGGHYWLSDAGSLNGTMIYRDDVLYGGRQEIPVNPHVNVSLCDGDIIRMGRAYFRWSLQQGQPYLINVKGVDQAASVRLMSERSVPLVAEQPLLERLQAMQGEVVELFTVGDKEKLVGRVDHIDGQGKGAVVHLRDNGWSQSVALSDILTVRGRAEPLVTDYIHPNVAHPQFQDRSINISGTDGSGKVVLVDFADPRLTHFLETHMRPIRHSLAAQTLSERQAAEAAWRIVRDYVPYDRARLYMSLPNQMYRLGDFIERGVCNERGMLLQVAYQFIGLNSRMEKGPFMGGRHAWTRAHVSDEHGQAFELILDPQRDSVIDVNRDDFAVFYNDDSSPFAQLKAATIAIGIGSNFSGAAVEHLQAEGLNPDALLDNLVELRSQRLGIEYGPVTWEEIQALRREQMHNNLWIIASDARHQIISINHAYEALAADARIHEQNLALALYERLTTTERHSLWLANGSEPDGRLPQRFIDYYRDLRLRLHDSGQSAFGDPLELNQILAEFGGVVEISVQNITDEMRTRYPLLAEPVFENYVIELSEQVMARWQNVGGALELNARGLFDVPEQLFEAVVADFALQLESRQSPTLNRVAASIRASDRGTRRERGIFDVRHIGLELQSRFPVFTEAHYQAITQALEVEIFTAWDQAGRPLDEGRPLVPGVVPERFINQAVNSLLAGFEQRSSTMHRVAANIRFSDRGVRADRDNSELNRMILRMIRESGRIVPV